VLLQQTGQEQRSRERDPASVRDLGGTAFLLLQVSMSQDGGEQPLLAGEVMDEPGVRDAGPPSDVTLRDGGDSVTLEWRYPAGGEGPVVISGGRTGQDRQAFQQLSAGSTSYVVYGLNDRADYCFTVAVVYSIDSVAGSEPVCTSR
jgi:hypothetical protein